MATEEPPPSSISPPTFQSGPSHDVSTLQQVLAGVGQPNEPTGNETTTSTQENPRKSSETTSIVYQDLEDMPHFKSALSYSNVRDFAYPIFHPLHYGVPEYEQTAGETEDDEEYEGDSNNYSYDYNDTYDSNDPNTHTSYNYNNKSSEFDDGPPWQEDADLNSPVIRSHEVGDRISKEYQFSVASADEIHGRAVALFDFTPENDNEAPLQEGQIVWISYRHGQGWLVAEDPETGETGLVPEEYVQLLSNTSYEGDEEILQDSSEPAIYQSPESDSEGWVDETEENSESTLEPVDGLKKLSVEGENGVHETIEGQNQFSEQSTSNPTSHPSRQ